MTITQEAVGAAANALYGKPICFNPECEGCEYERGEARAALAAALPHIEKEIRAQVAAELRGELPVQLAETAQSPSGWLSDAEELYPKADPSNEYVWLMSYDDSHSLGSIDISHVAEHAACIAEGSGE